MYITGVKKNDVASLEDIVETRFLRITTKISETKHDVDPCVPWRPTKNLTAKLPSHYSGPSSWPSKTDLKCMICGGSCDTLIFCPKNIDIKSSHLECDTEGSFNTFACAAYYIRYNKGNDETLKYALAKLYYEFTHKKIQEILPCPSPLLLEIHGGTMSTEAFIAQCVKSNSEIELTETEPEVICNSANLKELTDLYE